MQMDDIAEYDNMEYTGEGFLSTAINQAREGDEEQEEFGSLGEPATSNRASSSKKKPATINASDDEADQAEGKAGLVAQLVASIPSDVCHDARSTGEVKPHTYIHIVGDEFLHIWCRQSCIGISAYQQTIHKERNCR